MSPNRRILLNIAATYGRSLYALAIGLFSARWALQALGQTDYGLFGLVGGLIVLVTFINNILSFAVRRFYAISIGEAIRVGNEKEGLENCRRWFNTALSIHLILPFLLLLIGYPIGVWAIHSFLEIPSDRVSECVWVWRFSCLSMLISVANVPFNAMYTAKQEIAELTLYSLFTTTGKALFLYYMVNHPAVWLSRYAFGIFVLGAIPQFIIAYRALACFAECKVIWAYWFDIGRYKQLLKFAAAGFWSDFSGLVSGQGQSIVVNKYKGPVYNASMAVGNSVAAYTATLAASLSGALSPVVGTLCGEGRMDEMKKICFMACRLGGVLILVFAIPVALEIKEILRIWLVNPPDFAAQICVAMLVKLVLDRMTDGYWMAIYSRGYKVVKYSWYVGWAGISAVVVAWLGFVTGLGMWSIVIGIIAANVLLVVVRLVSGRFFVGFEVVRWLQTVFFPIVAITIVTICAGLTVLHFMPPSIFRILTTVSLCELVFLPLVWCFVLEKREQDYLLNKLNFFRR